MFALEKKKGLVGVSLLYLTLPYVVFFLGYARWYVAVFLSGCLLCGLLGAGRHSHSDANAVDVCSSGRSTLLLVCLVAAGMLIFAGVGGYGYQTEDWYKHNAILGALIDQLWPVSYTLSPALDGGSSSTVISLPLVYYIAYYLPAAVAGKVLGWEWANHVLFVWTYIGLCFAMLWFMALVQRSSLVVLLLFVFFSGLDAVGRVFVQKFVLQQPLHLLHWSHIEHWSGNWQYPANVSLLFWVPHQAISGWILCGIIFYTLLHAGNKKQLIFVFSLTLLWSPFLTIGLLPYLVVDFFSKKASFLRRVRGYLSWSTLGGMLIAVFLVLFYAARLYEIPLPLSPIVNGLIFFHPIVSGLFWYETLSVFLAFLVLEFGVYGWLIFKSRLSLTGREKMLLMTSLVILTTLPLFRYGFWNDLVMRASIPALFLVCVYVVKAFYSPSAPKRILLLLGLTFMLGAVNTAVELRRHVWETYKRGALVDIQEPRALYDVPNTNVNPSFFTQYVGSAESPFFRIFAKPLQTSEPVLAPSELSRQSYKGH